MNKKLKNITDVFHNNLLKAKECRHCGKTFTPQDDREIHQNEYCRECNEKHRGKEIIDEEGE